MKLNNQLNDNAQHKHTMPAYKVNFQNVNKTRNENVPAVRGYTLLCYHLGNLILLSISRQFRGYYHQTTSIKYTALFKFKTQSSD